MNNGEWLNQLALERWATYRANEHNKPANLDSIKKRWPDINELRRAIAYSMSQGYPNLRKDPYDEIRYLKQKVRTLKGRLRQHER